MTDHTQVIIDTAATSSTSGSVGAIVYASMLLITSAGSGVSRFSTALACADMSNGKSALG